MDRNTGTDMEEGSIRKTEKQGFGCYYIYYFPPIRVKDMFYSDLFGHVVSFKIGG
jgi:hypothetical protein